MNILGNNPLDKSSTSCCRRTTLKAKMKTIAYKELGIFLKDDVLKNFTKSRCQSYWAIIITAGSIFSTLSALDRNPSALRWNRSALCRRLSALCQNPSALRRRPSVLRRKPSLHMELSDLVRSSALMQRPSALVRSSSALRRRPSAQGPTVQERGGLMGHRTNLKTGGRGSLETRPSPSSK